ncbi:chymotrypsin-1-like [Pieris rapae]|uniref:chymotrypsin-1-like n=1 Tax=Pieris rapae TaxID=64459 RepID=UPI001E27C999|nr:chymotrypsin-1-like [Pieris rapae]
MFLHFGILLLLSEGLLGEVDVSEAVDGDSRIIGGSDATPDMAKYQVSIRITSGNKEDLLCGGSILNEEYVLTAANSFNEYFIKNMSIVVGTYTMDTGGDRYNIKKFIPHEEFSVQTLKNNIAIVQIVGKFKFGDNVQPIELLKEMAPIGKKCILTGWGYINYGKRIFANNLQMLEFETISNKICTRQLKRSPYPRYVPVDAGQLCAKRPDDKGACIGDNGSPLVIQDDKKKHIQIGVASWSVPCAEEYPDVFSSVHGFYDWIQNKIK